MTSPDVIRRRLDVMESAVGELRRFALAERIESDLVQRRFVEHTQQLAIQAAIDAATHVVASERLGTPRGALHAIELLVQNGWIERERLEVLRQIVGFREVLVHGDAEVDARILRDVFEHRLDDLLRFAAAIRGRLRPSAT